MEDRIDVGEEMRLAETYVARTDGPFVDVRRPLGELAEIYEKGHETFTKKLAKMKTQFPSWRRLRGDGSCGFRALLFGLLENVLAQKDIDLLRLVRDSVVKQWADLQIDDLYESWRDEITDLIDKLIHEISNQGDPMAEVTKSFNAEDSQREYIQFLRTLTACHLRAHRELYQASLAEDLDDWCQRHVEVPDGEIEYVSLAAAYAVLFSKLGITVKIQYLDLSPGDEANVHTFSPDTGSELLGKAGPVEPIWLLYRPGHYDLIYCN